MPGKRKEKKRLQQQNEAGLFDQHEQSEPRRITPVDIQQKEFRLAMRGYHERDVDEFLDEITEEVARLYAENKRLREELESKAPGRFTTGSGTAEAEAALQQARDEAANILADAESRARAISAAASGSASGPAGVPAVTGAALAGFLSREKSFLQNLARMMQDHANAMKEDVRRVRETATGARAGGSSGGDSLTGIEATALAQEAPTRQEQDTDHELWRPSQEESPPPPSVSSSPSAYEGPEGQPGWEESSRGEQPPYFMDQDPHVADPGSGSGQSPPVGGVEPPGPVRQEPDRSQSVIDLMDAERQPEAFETEAHPAQGDDVFEADAPSSFETHAPSSFEPPASQSSFEPPVPPVANPYVDEPTREWTLGEGGVDTGAAEESLVRGDAAPAPGSRGPRPAPRAEDEDSGDERSLKEMFWGED